MATVGDAVLIDSGPRGKHLFVIIWGPCQVSWLASQDQMILASVTTIYVGAPHDPACVLKGGEHPFVKHPSYVVYRQLRIDAPAHVDQMLASGLFSPQPAASPALLQQMQRGLCSSKLVDRRFKLLLNCGPLAVPGP